MAERRIRRMAQRVDDCAFRLEQLATSGRFFFFRTRQLERFHRSLLDQIAFKLRSSSERFRSVGERLEALSPLAVLDRGYAVCRRPDGGVVRSAGELELGSTVEIVLGKGALDARVTGLRRAEET